MPQSLLYAPRSFYTFSLFSFASQVQSSSWKLCTSGDLLAVALLGISMFSSGSRQRATTIWPSTAGCRPSGRSSWVQYMSSTLLPIIHHSVKPVLCMHLTLLMPSAAGVKKLSPQ